MWFDTWIVSDMQSLVSVNFVCAFGTVTQVGMSRVEQIMSSE